MWCWDISHKSQAVDSKEIYQKVWLLYMYSSRLTLFLGWTSSQTSLILNFLCFLALIIPKRQKFTLRTDFKQSESWLCSLNFIFFCWCCCHCWHSSPNSLRVLTTIVTIMHYYNIKINHVKALQHECESTDTNY